MKKALLILLMVVFPLQAYAAAERTLTHILGAGHGQGMAFVVEHMLEHAELIPHHHDEDDDDGDGTTYVDGSHKSLQHLADHEQGCGAHIVLPAINEPGLPAPQRFAPLFRLGVYSDRSTAPLLRPPRARA